MNKNQQNRKAQDQSEFPSNNEFENQELMLEFKDKSQTFAAMAAGLIICLGFFAATLSVGLSPAVSQATKQDKASSLEGAPTLQMIMSKVTIDKLTVKEAVSLHNDAPALTDVKQRLTIEFEGQQDSSKQELLTSTLAKKTSKSKT